MDKQKLVVDIVEYILENDNSVRFSELSKKFSNDLFQHEEMWVTLVSKKYILIWYGIMYEQDPIVSVNRSTLLECLLNEG